MDKDTLLIKALLDVRRMYAKIELATALLDPEVGHMFRNTLQDTDPRLLRELLRINKALETFNED